MNSMSTSPGVARTIAQLMAEFRRGNHDAAKQLVELCYPELKRLASSQMRRESSDHTWQPTALVNELYLELTKTKILMEGSSNDEAEKAAFLGLAGYLMKRLLIHHARPLYRHVEKVEPPEDISHSEQSLHEVEDTLSALNAIDPLLRSVVELKVFEGMAVEEIAGRLGISARTVSRHWQFAKHWLQQTMGFAT